MIFPLIYLLSYITIYIVTNKYIYIHCLSLTFTKILEKCIKSRVVNFLEKQTSFSNKQFGFRAGFYTSDALFNVDNFIRKKNIDENCKVMVYFKMYKKLSIL